ncbi:MAG TPA: urea amidolyase associated protein UAAP1 [Fibrobacteria bacterium]|nr:urea amidolyase associated protein UAAP1 [Fibrobacteria bacterium]
MIDESFIQREILPGGAMWSWTLKRGTCLGLTDVEGGANLSALFLNADAPLERYNMPDTLKAQFIAFLTRGNVLYSDMGRILCSIVEDTCGWHDTLCGATDAKWTEARFGASDYQRHRNDRVRNGRDNFLVELGKYGLGKKDLPVPVNFFSKVIVDEEGGLRWQARHSRPGAFVELRAEMNTLVVLSNTPHPLDPSPAYAPKPVGLRIRRGEAPGPDDVCRVFRPENGRGFINTEALFK